LLLINNPSQFQILLDEALERLNSTNEASSIGEIFHLLFQLSFEDLKLAEIGNPLEHHIIVLKHMIEIAQTEGLNILNAGAIALLHDIAPVEKIRKADVATGNQNGTDEMLEQKRRQHRILHMREGSAIAHRKLLTLNEFFWQIVYKEEDINEVCEVIRIHDNPSIGIPIAKENLMAVSFREADRLWMLSDKGFAYDIYRDKKNLRGEGDSKELASNRLQHVLKRYQEERRLYPTDDISFQDQSVFFRTKSGYTIFKAYLRERKRQYGV